MQRLLLVGLSHLTAPLEVREKLAFSPDRQREALREFRGRFAQAEAVVLSTCNRVELYVARPVHQKPSSEEIASFLAEFHGVEAAMFRRYLYEKSQADAAAHLFHVAASLDSMVLGETQIIGQVRAAYELAAEMGAAGPTLNPLFQRAIAGARQVVSQTPLAEGRVSVASVGVDFARRVFERFDDKSLLTIGAGKIGQLVLQTFVALKPKRIVVCNRDAERARATAAKYGAESVSFDRIEAALADADIVISSTGSAQPILSRRQFEAASRARRYKPIFVVDLAVPRDVEASVGDLEHVYLYNTDDLQSVVASTHSLRQDAISAARTIVQQQVDEFLAWQRARELGPVIDQLYRRYHGLAEQELQRVLSRLPNLSPDQAAQLREMTRRIVNKVLHDPVHSLRDGGAAHPPDVQYLHALEKLFNLEAGLEAESES